MIPAVMRRECDEIEMMVVEVTVSGQEAYEVVQNNPDNPCLGAVYLPFITDQSHGKDTLQSQPLQYLFDQC